MGEILKNPNFIKITGVISAIALSLGTIACGSGPEFNYGEISTVTEKGYDDPDTWTSFVLVGKVLVPVVHHDPAHWTLKLRQCGHEEITDDPEGCGDFVKEVSQETYNQYEVGSKIVLTK